jgi:hypothetical protein
MSVVLAFVVGILAGAAIGIPAWGVASARFGHSRGRDLASVFVGEIAALLRSIEVHEVLMRLEKLAGEQAEAEDAPELALPPFLIYRSNIRRLRCFRSALAREIVAFYTSLAEVGEELRVLAAPSRGPPKSRVEAARSAVKQLQETLELGDAVLRDLRCLVSRPRPSSILRA